MALETQYRGYKITYSENGDEWTCFDAGTGMAAPTLGKMKEKIDKLALSIRKASAFDCLELGHSDGISVTEAKITEYLGPRIERSYFGHYKPRIADHKVASAASRDGNGRIARREVDISSLMPITPEALAALEVAKGKYAILKAAKAEFDAAKKAIPRVTVDHIADLVKLSGIDPTGGINDDGKKA